MKHLMKGKLIREQGVTMVEYLIMMSLIAIVAIGIVTTFGDKVNALYKYSSQEMNKKS